MFLNSINYFRGIAILAIVTGHCYAIAGFDPWNGNGTLIERAIANLISGSTVFFVFISGFMFHYVFYQRGFDFSKFMKSKYTNVLLPYLTMSAVPILYAVFIAKAQPLDPAIQSNLVAIAVYLLTGQHLIGYWYIPFALLLFAASPLFLQFIRSRYQMLIIILSFGVAIWLHRPWLNLNPIQSLLYFVPVYLLGIWASMRRESIYQALQNKTIYLLLIAVFLAFLQALTSDEIGSFHRTIGWTQFAGLDINLIQKSILCLWFMVWLHFHVENRQIRVLEQCAKYSFPIYFLHAYVVTGLEQFGPNIQHGTILLAIALALLISGVCLAIAVVIHHWIPKYSRPLIGV